MPTGIRPWTPLAIDERHEGVFVDGPVAERGHERRQDAVEERFGHDVGFGSKMP